MPGFKYANSSIRVDGPLPAREGVEWFSNATELWNSHINWAQAQTFIDAHCHGTTAGAQILQNGFNILEKYVGGNGLTAPTKTDLAYGLTQELVDSLNTIAVGGKWGTAMSLMDYMIDPASGKTASKAGFDFETMLSEVIKHIAFDPLPVKTGKTYVNVGANTITDLGTYQGGRDKFVHMVKEMGELEYENFMRTVFQEIPRYLEDGTKVTDLAAVGYKVPRKADIQTHSYMTFSASFSGEMEQFFKELSNVKLSAKNSRELNRITLDDTNDGTRLRSFISEFAQGINKDFSTVCTFIYSSKNSSDPTVQKYIDWGRILYALIGVGQHATEGDNLLVDYLIVNTFTVNQRGTGSIAVFNVKDLISAYPMGNYSPPFFFSDANHEGTVYLDLTNVSSFSFS